MSKPPKDFSFKSSQRDRIQREIEDFLSRGGQIETVAPGASGAGNRAPGAWRPGAAANPTPPRERIPLDHLLVAIDQRRKPARPAAKTSARKRPRKRLIYDDFGEPLRWEWVDE